MRSSGGTETKKAKHANVAFSYLYFYSYLMCIYLRLNQFVHLSSLRTSCKALLVDILGSEIAIGKANLN